MLQTDREVSLRRFLKYIKGNAPSGMKTFREYVKAASIFG